jgi:hypothetical protein
MGHPGLSSHGVLQSEGAGRPSFRRLNVFDRYRVHRSRPNGGHHGMRRALVNNCRNAESLLPGTSPEVMALLDNRTTYVS